MRRKNIWRFKYHNHALQIPELVIELFLEKIKTVFLLISAPRAYLISWLKGGVLNRGRYIKEGGAFFKLGRIIHIKIQNFVIFASQIKINKYSCSGPPTFKSGSCKLRFSYLFLCCK